MDGSDADPRAQISAVREVLGQIGAAGKVPELVVVNKADEADPIEIKGLCLAERGAVVVSARTGRGLDGLLAAVEAALPRRDAEVSALVPGRDLVARAHREGEVLAVAHCEGGTQLTRGCPRIWPRSWQARAPGATTGAEVAPAAGIGAAASRPEPCARPLPA